MEISLGSLEERFLLAPQERLEYLKSMLSKI